MIRAQKTTWTANERALEMIHSVAEKTPLTICQNIATTNKSTEGAKLKSTSDSIDAKAATGGALVIDSMISEVKEAARTRPVVTDRAADERGEQLAPHRRRPAMTCACHGQKHASKSELCAKAGLCVPSSISS